LPDDPSDRPTQMAEYGADGVQVLPGGPDGNSEGAEPDSAPDPWYRSRVLLALWALLVALLLGLIIYGIVGLSRGGGSSVPAPHPSSTTPTRSSSTSPTTTTSSTTTEAPSSETPEQTPEEAPPPPANNSPEPAEPPRHRHHLHVPSTITLPHTVITLPHGF
jgi:cytoskeletal protein RodZ